MTKPNTETRIALLIDADNAPAAKIDVILAEVARHGAANVRRAYGNWKSPHLKSWEATLHAYAIRPIQQFAYSSGKNASDMAMVIDAHGPAVCAQPRRLRHRLQRRRLHAAGHAAPDRWPEGLRLRRAARRRSRSSMPARSSPTWRRLAPGLGAAAATVAAATQAERPDQGLRGDARLVQMLRSAVDVGRPTMTAGRTSAPSGTRSATRLRSTRATTATASSVT